LFTAPQEHVQPSSSAGLLEPHSGQKLPVTVAPQEHFHAPGSGFGSGFFAPQFGQKLPVTVVPHAHFHPPAAGAACGTGAGCGVGAACCYAAC